MKRKLHFVLALLAMVTIATMFTTATAEPMDRVEICHVNSDDPTEPPMVTIMVSGNAVPAHLAHGDTLGACAQ